MAGADIRELELRDSLRGAQRNQTAPGRLHPYRADGDPLDRGHQRMGPGHRAWNWPWPAPCAMAARDQGPHGPTRGQTGHHPGSRRHPAPAAPGGYGSGHGTDSGRRARSTPDRPWPWGWSTSVVAPEELKAETVTELAGKPWPSAPPAGDPVQPRPRSCATPRAHWREGLASRILPARPVMRHRGQARRSGLVPGKAQTPVCGTVGKYDRSNHAKAWFDVRLKIWFQVTAQPLAIVLRKRIDTVITFTLALNLDLALDFCVWF